MITLQIYEISQLGMTMKMCLTVSSSGKEMIYLEILTLLPAQCIEMLYLPSHPDCIHHHVSSTPQQNVR